MINLLFGDWKIIGEENEMRSEVLGVNKNSPIYDGEGYDFLNNLYLLLLLASYSFIYTGNFDGVFADFLSVFLQKFLKFSRKSQKTFCFTAVYNKESPNKITNIDRQKNIHH